MRRRFASVPKEQEYMIIEALEDALTVSLNGTLNSPCVEYSLDGEEWFVLNLENTTPPINKGEFILFKGNYRQTATNYFTFVISTKCNLLGSCMSLLGNERLIKNKTLEGADRVFVYLFNSCPIVSVSEDFLPATILSESCYDRMFSDCTNLVNAPTLPATTLANHCYDHMFANCTKLNHIKMLATDISASNCLLNWVNGVASSGTFVKNPEATWEVYGDNGIPNGWKVVMDGEEDENILTFPHYIKSVEGSGEYRFIEKGQLEKVIAYFNEHADYIFDDITLDLEFEPGQLYFDEFEVSYMSKRPEGLCITVSFYNQGSDWFASIYDDGHGDIEYWD